MPAPDILMLDEGFVDAVMTEVDAALPNDQTDLISRADLVAALTAVVQNYTDATNDLAEANTGAAYDAVDERMSVVEAAVDAARIEALETAVISLQAFARLVNEGLADQAGVPKE